MKILNILVVLTALYLYSYPRSVVIKVKGHAAPSYREFFKYNIMPPKLFEKFLNHPLNYAAGFTRPVYIVAIGASDPSLLSS